jgi:hypothetical protein
MRIFASLLLVFAIALTGCKSAEERKKKREAALTKKKAKVELREENTEVDFQAFVSRLRKAVATRDVATLRTMMTPDFGYKIDPDLEGIDPTPDGPGAFRHWDQEGLWPELEGILSERFVKSKDYMVAPPQWADPSLSYDGYRAGIRRVNGSWKFAYFVNG